MSNDEINPQDLDDTAGHVLHGEAAQNPTGIGGRAPSLIRVDQEADDVEGHVIARQADDDEQADDSPAIFKL